MLGALAQETRLGVFRLLVAHGPMGLAAGAIAEALDVPAATLSFHLAQLTRAGLLGSRRASRHVIYAVDFTAMNALMAFMLESCCAASASAGAPAPRGRARETKR